MKTKQIIGLVIAAVLFIVVGVSSVLTNTFSQNMLAKSAGHVLTGDYTFQAPLSDYIAVVEVQGMIQEQTESSVFAPAVGYQHTTTKEYIDDLMSDPRNQGMLLYVDSPGGTAYESEELYQKIREYKETTGRPVWAYMAHYAASGGYMISAAADKIYANQNTTTGSIGVIMSGFDLSGLYEKLGIQYFHITSGDYKAGDLSEGQIAIYQSQIDELYGRFVGIVAEGREMSVDEVKALADGRTYTAQQALGNGLIDEISLYEDMKAAMSEELGVYEYYSLKAPSDILSTWFARIEEVIPKSEAQILKETAAEMESGVPMYYAEQLQ